MQNSGARMTKADCVRFATDDAAEFATRTSTLGIIMYATRGTAAPIYYGAGSVIFSGTDTIETIFEESINIADDAAAEAALREYVDG